MAVVASRGPWPGSRCKMEGFSVGFKDLHQTGLVDLNSQSQIQIRDQLCFGRSIDNNCPS